MMHYDDKSEVADPDRDKLDCELNAALAKFTRGEPRAGLEDRILANLRMEREHVSARAWWRWPAQGVTAAVVTIAAISFMWKSGKPTPNLAVHQPAKTVQSDKQTEASIPANYMGSTAHPAVRTATKKPTSSGVFHPSNVSASGPRLAQFPSRRPLSEEEQLLVRYVQDFPQEAATIAKAEAESEKEIEQLGGDQPSKTNSDQQNQP